ncbi:MAG: gliding motility-associated C-terminal domain-containing protein [Ferruginibacter sp.]
MRSIKIYLPFFVLLACSYGSQAQKQLNTWYFGTRVGLNFNVIPPQALTNGMGNAIESCSTVSDGSGNLLFYTNGIKIINKQHLIMQNGDNILGDLSSTCGAVIVQQAGHDGIYYVFTIGSAGQSLKGFKYSVVDIKRNGGLGEVIQKNNYIDEDCYEKIAAVRHCNKRDVWLTVRIWDTDEYHSYLLTSTGLNPVPVISHTGLVINGIPNNSIGALKFSVDGTKLVAVHSFQNDCVELMNFNNITGIISNPIVFKPNAIAPALTGVYGAEFSPNGKLLYISSNNSSVDPATLYQFDISSMNAATILASKQVIAQTNPWIGGGLQMGPDQKIYYSLWKDTSLSVIEDPDVYGPGCNFVFNKILLSKTISEPSQFGLPAAISSDNVADFGPYNFERVGGDCRNFDVTFQLNRVTGIDSVRWDFGDTQQSTSLAPMHHYNVSGNYNVTLLVYSINCGINTIDTLTQNVFLTTPSSQFLPVDTTMCEIKDLAIVTTVTAQTYLWSTGAATAGIVVSDTGTYWLQIETDGCVSRDSVNIYKRLAETVNLGRDTTVCVNKPVILDAGIGGVNYLWSTGDNTRTIQVSKPGIFWLEVSSATKCPASDTVNVQWGDCELFLPTAFSPNGDGLNETFGLINGINTSAFSIKIYNRNGQVVFNSSDQFRKWDGRYKNKPVPMGVYPWILTYTNKNGYVQTETGTVMLIR